MHRSSGAGPARVRGMSACEKAVPWQRLDFLRRTNNSKNQRFEIPHGKGEQCVPLRGQHDNGPAACNSLICETQRSPTESLLRPLQTYRTEFRHGNQGRRKLDS